MAKITSSSLRNLPSVSTFLTSPEGEALCQEFGTGLVKLKLQASLDSIRAAAKSGKVSIPENIRAFADLLRPELQRLATLEGRRAINATGILLHTGLGRAPLCEEAVTALSSAGHYSPVQIDLETAARSLREEKIEQILRHLTGCEAATVVNNNAAATMLLLNTLAAGKEVIISRGQLIEIGGSFRMPEVMAMSSAILHEVGCSNRTHLRDYEAAISEETGAIIHAHTSNYRVRGFGGTPDIKALAELGRKHGIPVIDDIGSGALVPLRNWGVSNEPLVAESVQTGIEAACFSGDKLICGPQCGIIVGKQEVIKRIRKNPFARMFRVCKLTLAALETTLLHFLNNTYCEHIPFYQMLSLPMATLQERAQQLMGELKGMKSSSISIEDDISYIGSGSCPDEGLSTKAIQIHPQKISLEEAARQLRLGVPAVFCRINDSALLFDVRTIFPDEIAPLASRLHEVLGR
ncbi:MAG: L-seryl-tRNA(Sec) selenium transferase [Planctomycetes bacterium]|nr:L-seryl-tRNA(Sec) selenium transferase [Planctomycetota bacterium]